MENIKPFFKPKLEPNDFLLNWVPVQLGGALDEELGGGDKVPRLGRQAVLGGAVGRGGPANQTV